MKISFRDKIVLITGGCSGIGKIMARKALERGASTIIILDINSEGLAQVQHDFAHFGKQVLVFEVNLAKPEEIIATAQRIKSEVGSIDILINNAGVVTGKYFHEHTHEQIKLTMAVNSEALMHLTLEFLPLMMQQNFGAVCTIASSAGLISNTKMSVYAASKWAAVGWSDSLRLEMESLEKNISVTTVMPFYINTGMFDGVKSRVLPILEPEPAAEKMIKAIEDGRKMLGMPLPYWFIRLSQGLLPLGAFEWVMKNVFGIYDTMKDFKGRE